MNRRIPVPAGKLPQAGGRALFEFDDKSLALFNVEGDVFAVDDSCPHQGASLCGGRLEGWVIQCCAHGLRFDQRNFGAALSRHARRPHATAAATDHQQIKIKNCHENLWVGKPWGKP